MTKKNEKIANYGVLPNSVEAEQSLLCCIMRDPSFQLEIISNICPADFYQKNHGAIFSAMQNISRSNTTVDLATLLDELRRSGSLADTGGVEYLIKLNDMLPSTARFAEYLKIVKRTSLMRRLIAVAGEITEVAYTEADDEKAMSFASEKIFELMQHRNTSELSEFSNEVVKAVVEIGKRYASPEAFHGIKTGFKRLDKLTNGFHGGELIILAARPSVGKSALAMNMVENIARNGRTVAVFSLEMSKRQLIERLLSSIARVPLSEIRNGKLAHGENDIVKINNAAEIISSKMHIYGNDNPNIRIAEIRSQCRRLKAKKGLDAIVIDYIGLMEDDELGSGSNRQNQVARISRGLKILAKELDVPVLALCQLKREYEIRNLASKDKSLGDNVPVLSDLRESGAIEQDADIVMFIHREEKDGKDEHALIVAKQRNGECGAIPLAWNSSFVRFEDESSLEHYIKTLKSNGGDVTFDAVFEVNNPEDITE